jgi:hypothetical protein
MTVRIAALLGKLAQSLILQLIHNHTRRDSNSFDDKQQGLMGVVLLLHWVHTQPAVLSAESMTVVVAVGRQNTSVQRVTEHGVRQTLVPHHPIISRHAPRQSRMQARLNTVQCRLLYRIQCLLLINVPALG